MDSAGSSANEFSEIRIHLLRHRARAGGEAFGQCDEAEFRGGEERDLFCEAADMKCDGRERLQKFDQEIAVAGGVHAVGSGSGKAELARGNRAIESKRGARDRAGAKRAIVQPRRSDRRGG